MNKELISELEKFFFDARDGEELAASNVAGVIGVLIDLKSAMAGDFKIEEYKKIDVKKLRALLGSLGLVIIFAPRGDDILFYISRDEATARELSLQFETVWNNMSGEGIADKNAWSNATMRIGELLGYPKTAVIDFVALDEGAIGGEERIARMCRNRYYSHSAEHEEEEYAAYDRILNQAIEDNAPKTAAVFKSKQGKRWL